MPEEQKIPLKNWTNIKNEKNTYCKEESKYWHLNEELFPDKACPFDLKNDNNTSKFYCLLCILALKYEIYIDKK